MAREGVGMGRWGRSVCALALVLASLEGVAVAQGVARLVLVVGNNRPADPTQTSLHYADDDAARYYDQLGARTETRLLLTRFDADSALYRSLYPQVSPPTRAALERAVALLRAQAAALRSQGRFVELVFVFAGHGGVERGHPYLALEDGRLGQDALEALVLGIPTHVTHVVIDACSAASFVEGRGPLRGDRQALPDRLLPFGGLVERHPRAGFVVAASADGSAFEWSRFGSGVASHLLRSALAGAADMTPPDGRVTYEELEAFLRTATAGVLPAEYRQEMTVVAPRALPSAALVDLRSGDGVTEILVDRPGRYYVRDADGHRIVDLRAGRGTARLVLPPYSPRFALVDVREEGVGCGGPGRRSARGCTRQEHVAEVEAGGSHRVSELEETATTVAARGLIEDSVFENLFREPYEIGVLATDARAEVSASADAVTIPSSLRLGYRAAFGEMMQDLGPVQGLEAALQISLPRRFLVSAIVSAGRGNADPPVAASYPVYQVDLGAEVAYALVRQPLVTLGVDLRWQFVDQIPKTLPEAWSSVGALGAVARAQVGFVPGWALTASVSAGARLGSVDDELRLRPFASGVLGVAAEL